MRHQGKHWQYLLPRIGQCVFCGQLVGWLGMPSGARSNYQRVKAAEHLYDSGDQGLGLGKVEEVCLHGATSDTQLSGGFGHVVGGGLV